jgi:transcription elongation GreA/GreB family factor
MNDREASYKRAFKRLAISRCNREILTVRRTALNAAHRPHGRVTPEEDELEELLRQNSLAHSEMTKQRSVKLNAVMNLANRCYATAANRSRGDSR